MASSRRAARLRRDLDPLYALAAAVFIAVGSWYLLKELAPLLRPLVLAVFLAYTILPAHHALRQRVHAKFAGPLLGPAHGDGVARAGRAHLRQPRRSEGRVASA